MAPLSAQLGIDETSSDALNEVDAELNSENPSAPGETGGRSQVCESSVARPLGSEAATPAAAADAASGEGSLATGARDEGQAKAVIAQPAEPSVEAEKNSPAGKTGRDHEVGDSSVAVASFDGAAVDPLREALAALDDRDYATAQRLFAAIGRKDVAEAIKGALAALDRKDYAKAQGLFEALGQKGAAAAQVKGSAPASPAPLKPAAWAGGAMGSDSRNKALDRNPVTSPVEAIPLADSAYRPPLPQAEKAEPRRLKPLLLGTGLVLFAILGVSAIYGSPLNWTFPATKSQAIAGLSSAADVLKADLEAITGQSAREEERSAAKPEVAGALVDRAAAARVDEDLDYKIAQRKGSVEGWRSFLAAHGSGVHAQSAKAEVEKLLLAGQDPAPAAAEVSNGSSTDAKTGSEVMGSAPPDPGTEVAALTPDEICKRDGERLERLRSRPTNDEAARFAGELGCEKLRPQLLGLMESLGYAAPAPAAAPPIPSVKLGSALGPKWRATVAPVTKGKDLRPQEEESPPIEVEKQQAEAGKEGNEAKNGSEAKEADEMKLTKETKVMDRSAKSPVIDGRETDSTNGPTTGAIPLARPEQPPSQHIRRHSGKRGHWRERPYRWAFYRLTGVARAYPFVWYLAR